MNKKEITKLSNQLKAITQEIKDMKKKWTITVIIIIIIIIIIWKECYELFKFVMYDKADHML